MPKEALSHRILLEPAVTRSFSFVLWLFDTRGDFFAQEYMPEFEAMNNEDPLDFQRRQ